MPVYVYRKTRWAGTLFAFSLVALGACSTTNLPASSSHNLATLAELFEGRFDTHAQLNSSKPPAGVRVTGSLQRVVAPTLGEYVYYLQLNRGDKLKLYRQRLLTLNIDPVSDTVVERAFTLLDANKFIDARTGDPVLTGVTAKDIKPVFDAGCDQVWKRTADGFYGHVDPATCRIYSKRRNEHRRFEAEIWLTDSTLALAERGFDDQMKQEFGTAPGDSTLLHRLKSL